MVYQISDNIISSLGFSSEENYQAVKHGKSGVQFYENKFGLHEPFVASLIDDEKLEEAFCKLKQTENQRYTKFEKSLIVSIQRSLQQTEIDPADNDVLFIISTTKGNVDLLEDLKSFEPERIYLWRSAQLIASFFCNKNKPVVVSNACISGSVAQISASRFLESGKYKYIIVAGADMLSKFIISGFQSFKALSLKPCKPFDKNRNGLNLGEAAATIIYGKENDVSMLPKNSIVLSAGFIANDANHISGPSRTGAGLSLAIDKTLKNIDLNDIGFVNAHGTATLYNDDMESMAIAANQLQNHPINSLKGYFGHTLGAAGVLEAIVSSYALKDDMVLKSNGLYEIGTVCPLRVTTENEMCSKKHFLKLMSGFGGCNAAALFTKIKV